MSVSNEYFRFYDEHIYRLSCWNFLVTLHVGFQNVNNTFLYIVLENRI